MTCNNSTLDSAIRDPEKDKPLDIRMMRLQRAHIDSGHDGVLRQTHDSPLLAVWLFLFA